jgi:hypothetical protein
LTITIPAATVADRPAADSAFPGVRWHGHWIAPEPLPEPGDGPSFGGDVAPREFSRVQYRRTIELDSVPSTVPARLTADSRYVLTVNGREVGRGPIRSQPRRLRYDEYDLAPYLSAGANVVAVLVTYYGRANSFWQPAASNGGFGTDALLVFEARLGEDWLVSDEDWRVHRSAAWRDLPHSGLDGVPIEALDARLLDPAWLEAGFDESGWAAATVAKVSHIGGFATSQPPTDPYGALLPRGISMLDGEYRVPEAVLDSSSAPRPDWPSENPAQRAVAVLTALAESGAEATPGALPLSVDVDARTVQHVALDFGRIVSGFVELDLTAPAGTTVELYYRELPFDIEKVGAFAAPNTGARYIARGADDEYRSLELNGVRYLHLLVHADGDAAASIDAVRMREHHYPQSGEAFFRSSDPEIDALYAAGIRTVSMNAFDSYTDCPTREQRAWVGDGVVHQLVHLSTNTDWGLARNYVTLGDSPRADHMLPMTVVGEIEHGGSVTIPDWAMHWTHGVYNLFRYCGPDDLVLGVLPTMEKVLRWYLPYVDETGVISDVPEWNLVDWSSVFSTGRSSILTSLWARGLAEYAEICEHIGNAASARWARAHWESARAGLEDFWDEERGTYVDHFLDGERMPAASQAAGAAAIVSGLAPRERWSRIIDAITDEDAVVVRSWIGGEHGGYDAQKMKDQANGVQRIDWDVDTQIVRAEPFLSYLVHDAVAAAGRAAELVGLVRRWSGFLVDGYDTFGECWGWGTPVHGWSSTPTKDLVQHVLGIQPAEPGFGAVRVAPALGALEWAEAAAPTPSGLVRVRVDRDSIAVDSPVPVVIVHADGSETRHAAGHTTTPR